MALSTQRAHNIETTLRQRRNSVDVASTLIRRCINVMCCREKNVEAQPGLDLLLSLLLLIKF